MAITYSWAVKSMYCVQSPNPDYVVNVLWELTGTDGTHTASIDGNSVFQAEQEPNFVPYQNLTQDIVIGWVQAALGAQGIANYEANVNGQIQSMITPPVSPQNTPLPWVQGAKA
jgi:hypothetical protein